MSMIVVAVTEKQLALDSFKMETKAAWSTSYALVHPLRSVFQGHDTNVYRARELTNGVHEAQSASEAVRNGDAHAISYSQNFMANPDLPDSFRNIEPLNDADSVKFHAPDPVEYIDYPA